MTAVPTSTLNLQTGAAPTFQAAATSNTGECPGSGQNNIFVVIRNSNAATRTVTVVVPGNTSYGSANPDPTSTLAATTGENWYPVRPEMVNAQGVAEFQLDVVTNVTIAWVKVG